MSSMHSAQKQGEKTPRLKKNDPVVIAWDQDGCQCHGPPLIKAQAASVMGLLL
jgi:hypothetical protein